MTGAIAPLTDFSGWARGDLLVIVLLVLGAILLTRLANWVRSRIIAQINAHAIEADELVRSEAAKHRQVVAQVVTWAVLAVIYVVTAVLRHLHHEQVHAWESLVRANRVTVGQPGLLTWTPSLDGPRLAGRWLTAHDDDVPGQMRGHVHGRAA